MPDSTYWSVPPPQGAPGVNLAPRLPILDISQLPSSVVTVSPFASSTTIYVSVTGSNANSGLAPDRPMATISAAVAALGGNPGTVQVGAGQFTFTGTVTLLSGQAIIGQGPQVTQLAVPLATTLASLPNGAINLAGNFTRVSNLSISGVSSTASLNCAADFIKCAPAAFYSSIRLTFLALNNSNGWGINILAGTGTNTPIWMSAIVCTGGGGVHVQGANAAPSASALLDGIYLNNLTTTDGLFIEDVVDVLAVNVLGEILTGAYACLHIKGICSDIQLSNVAVSTAGQASSTSVLIEKSANGSPKDISWHGGLCLKGDYGMKIIDLNGKLNISGVDFAYCNYTGLYVPSGGTIGAASLSVAQCKFIGNNASSTTGYDVDIEVDSTHMTASFVQTSFESTSVSSSMKCAGSNAIRMLQCVNASGQGATAFFTTAPALIVRDTLGFNPVGVLTGQPTFVSTTPLVNGNGMDITVYLMTGAVTAVNISGVESSGALPLTGPWIWPAGSTITFTFTVATFRCVGN